MAEDDDDEAFGDFAFAPFQSTYSQSNGLNSLADADADAADDEDDEWGDFVQTPQSEASSKGNHQPDFASPTWVKPSGALSLSLFGDEAEEEEEVSNSDVVRDLNQGKSNGKSGDFNFAKVDNGVPNSHSFSITDLYNQYSQIKPGGTREGSDSTGKVDLIENGAYLSSNQNATRSAVTELNNVELNGKLGKSDHNQLTNKSENEEFSFGSYVSDPSKNDHNQLTNKSENNEFSFGSYVPDRSEKEDLFGGWTQGINGFSSSLNATPQNLQTSGLGLDMDAQEQQLDGSATPIDGDDEDDGGWEFQDAYSEFQAQELNNNVGFVVHEVSERSASPSGFEIGSNKPLDLFDTSNGSIDFFVANSSSICSTSQEVDLFGVQPSIATPNGFSLDTHSIIEQSNCEGRLNNGTDVGIEEFDDDFGDFTVASAETGPKPAEVSTIDIISPVEDAISTPDGKTQEKEAKSNYHKGAIPLSIFGNEEPESELSSDLQDVFMNQSSFERKDNHTAAKVVSINDLIFNLYSQSEQTSSINPAQNPNKTLLNLPSTVSSSNVVNDDDLLDGSSWDFKDASQMRAESEASHSSMEDTYTSTSVKLNSYLDLYSKLKEELCFVAKHHIECLKQVQSNAAVGIDAEAVPLDSEFKTVYAELEQMNFVSEKRASHPSGDSHLKEFAKVLLEPQFQRIESEYHLSRRLLLVEKDLGSAMELIRHTNTMIKILTTGTFEEQKMYVSLWSEMISACSRELKHGASIWNKAVEKHVQIQLLSEPQGRKFLLALGEIYRVVVVLGASAKLFEPWVLSGSEDSQRIYSLLEECHDVWSTSGLQKALSTTLDDTSLFESIQGILGLDAVTLQNYVFTENESRCRLSMLTTGVVPDLKMIMWGNEQCFITLANLWTNLISCDPPNLPQLNIG
ncbi:hypothetical protein ACS0TY_005713 [Phlomoides rotata]